tara:strand:+ start:1183 stop:2415 length:1233 start_codon:yes stop_codon:yes gene_type:complete
MSGLLDIWEQWRNSSGYGETTGSSTDFSTRKTYKRGQTERSDLSTAGGVEPTGNIVPRTHVGRQNIGQVSQKSNTAITPESSNFQTRFKAKKNNQWMGPGEQVNKGLTESAGKTTQTWVGDGPWKMRSNADSKFHENGGEQEKWWNTLANKIGFDYDRAKATWKDKGGFEGLMANPAFTMGLAFLQAGAEGKNIGQGALDNVVKAGGISQHYKKIIEDRKQAPIEVTAADVSDVKDLLATMKVEEPNMFEKAWGFITKGDTGQAAYDQASEQIASAVQKEIESMQRNHKGKEPFVIDIELKKKVIRKVLKSGKIKYKKSLTPWTSGTVKSTSENPFGGYKAEGGPVEAGKAYVVGEKGPEVIIPTSDGEVLSNDDSQIYAMLLASNPQLQKVSRTRAEKILRSRFPEYFE